MASKKTKKAQLPVEPVAAEAEVVVRVAPGKSVTRKDGHGILDSGTVITDQLTPAQIEMFLGTGHLVK